MLWPDRILLRLRALFQRGRFEGEMDEELRFHLESQIEDHIKRGMNPEKARRAALLSFGGIDKTKEECRDTRWTRFLEDLWRDSHYAVRTLVKNPGFTIVAVLALSLGVGANTAIFSVVRGVLLSPLPFEHSDQLVRLYETTIRKGGGQTEVSPADFVEWRNRCRSFKAMAAVVNPSSLNLTGAGEPEQVRAMPVTSDFFPLLGSKSALGRLFLPQEYESRDTSAVILSHGLWQRRFGGNPNLIGQTITLSDKSATVVGVMPDDFSFTEIAGLRGMADCWIPQSYKENENPRARYLTVIARLRGGVSFKQAQAEMDVLAHQIEKSRSESNAGWGVRLVPLLEDIVGDFRNELLILSGAVGFVLLIACANIANLLLARAANRQKEFALRIALGASRARLLRQLLTESIVLSLAAGMLGLVLAGEAVKGLIAVSPENLPRLTNITVNTSVFGFMLIVSFLTGVVCGSAPAFRSSKTDLTLGLKEGGTSSMGERRGWLGSSLVVSEIALALVLLIGAGLLIRSFIQLQSINLGFIPKDLLTLRLFPAGSRYLVSGKYSSTDAVNSFYTQLLEKFERIPGVDSAGMGGNPLARGTGTSLHVEGQQEPVACGFDSTSPNYFRALRIPLLSGRLFTRSDTNEAPRVAIVNRTMAQRSWPGENAVGKRITMGDPTKGNWIRIVGVVEDVRSSGLERDPRPEVYIPYLQKPGVFSGFLVVRTGGDPISFASAVRSAVWSIDKNQPVDHFATMEQLLSRAVAHRRFNLVLIGVFSALAFMLAAIGIYGVMAYTVAQRTQEIGIRIALGAEKRDVLSLIVGKGLLLVIIGEALGLVGAFALNKVMSSMVFQVTTTDPFTYAAVAFVWAAVALLACYVPARRATNVDPMIALRHE